MGQQRTRAPQETLRQRGNFFSAGPVCDETPNAFHQYYVLAESEGAFGREAIWREPLKIECFALRPKSTVDFYCESKSDSVPSGVEQSSRLSVRKVFGHKNWLRKGRYNTVNQWS